MWKFPVWQDFPNSFKMEKVRVRFAPSPTGALHIGGVRTALFNYLFAKKNNGDFILRIEDTDQTRYVEGAEEYILNALKWLGIEPDESPIKEGEFGPYRQSERKNHYQEYVAKLLKEGKAYYAFDTPEELEDMRRKLQESRVTNPQYDTITRTTMKNSLTLPPEEVQARIEGNEPYVIRIKVPEKEDIRLRDMVRGWVKVSTDILDDKVLMKSDGMPTYHLANVVDDHLMKITHVIRGEEWLPSAPLHVLLYEYLGLEDKMPQFAHLPLILKPDGNGKLSKRAADKAGFPIFPMDWKEPQGAFSKGFKEIGFLPEALLNFLVFLGWNPGTEQELFTINELINEFSIKRVNKAGTKFDFEKAKWFNQQYLKSSDPRKLGGFIANKLAEEHSISCSEDKAIQIFDLFKERVTFPQEIVTKSLVLFHAPQRYDEKTWSKKWNEDAGSALELFITKTSEACFSTAEEIKNSFWNILEAGGLKPGQYLPPLRLAVTGEGFGPDLMQILMFLGYEEVKKRIFHSIDVLNKKRNK